MRALTRYGTLEQIETYAKPQIEGRWLGTMCLSEPEAGSSLVEIKTRALDRGDGTYAVIGNKMWISGGDQEISENIVHLVLAKIDGALSLPIVPKVLPNGTRNDVQVAGLNHKNGLSRPAQLPAQFWGAGRGNRLFGRRSRPGPKNHVYDDE